MTTNTTNTLNSLDLRNQIFMECNSMAKYAMAKGKPVPASAIKTIEAFDGKNTSQTDIDALVDAHDLLARIIDPAAPQTILLLDTEQKAGSPLKFLGPIGLVRELMAATLISLMIFVALISSPMINADKLAEDVFTAQGPEQLARLIFYIGAAGLGASFAALYKANGFITNGTFDPGYQASYWIRFVLGLIAGLLLAVLISEDSIKTEGMLSKGVIRPLLAILGGFSADLLYSFLIRMVETFKSLFESSTQNILDAKAIEAKAKLASLEVDNRMKLTQDLMQLQQQIGTTADPEQIKQQLNDIMQNLMKPK